jgi:hypothetical protein
MYCRLDTENELYSKHKPKCFNIPKIPYEVTTHKYKPTFTPRKYQNYSATPPENIPQLSPLVTVVKYLPP